MQRFGRVVAPISQRQRWIDVIERLPKGSAGLAARGLRTSMASQPRRPFNTTTSANAAAAIAEEPESKDILNVDRDVLPRLPVPDLKNSCELFLKSVKPLATEEEFNAIRDKVDGFVAEGGLGSRLQTRLEEFDGKQEVCGVERRLVSIREELTSNSTELLARGHLAPKSISGYSGAIAC